MLVRKTSFIDGVNFSSKNSDRYLRIINFKKKERKIIDKGILIGGNGSFNWYHWIVECLPKLFLSNYLPNEFYEYPLIVPDICQKNKNFMDSLSIFNKIGRDILYFGIKDIIFANKLVYIENVVEAPFVVKRRFKIVANDYSQNDDLILKYSNKFHKHYKSKTLVYNKKYYKRIFLARKNSLRQYNQKEILEIARRYKFKEFYLEDLDLLEQISLFSNAKYIVGPSGAAWTGLIFAKNNKLKCLSWLPDYLNQFCSFSNLANILNHDLKFIKTENSFNIFEDYDFHSSFHRLNPTVFEIEIKKLFLD